MAKHKIVKFTDGLAKIQITDDFTEYLPLEDNKTLFINPDLKYVRGVSPEFWTVKDGVIWALEGEEFEERRKIMEIQSAVSQKSDHRLIEEILLKIEAVKDEARNNLVDSVNLLKSHENFQRREQSKINDRLVGETYRIDKDIDSVKQYIDQIVEVNENKIKQLNKNYIIVAVILSLLALIGIVK